MLKVGISIVVVQVLEQTTILVNETHNTRISGKSLSLKSLSVQQNKAHHIPRLSNLRPGGHLCAEPYYKFAIFHVVYHSNVNSIQNPSTVTM